ncbi:TRAP transporter large permease [Oceanobacillus saliphilus]|uniref:TRAP transporter large permease n=1 Tax=Oceanobacillus saliphilus TaxID=2925834 RepID=UPI00201E046E|nr:TRAP transporter large permease [Oceanobacillus saliphilus]
MSVEAIGATILIGGFILLILLRIPIAYALGISSVVTAMYLNLPLTQIVQSMVNGANVFSLLAVPFFILAGELMSRGGISDRLIEFAKLFVGRIRGGLGQVNIITSTFFGGISGSSAADTASLGPVLIPMMKKEGFDSQTATSITMASSVQAILIPPSHNMIIYSLAAGGVSIGGLFLAGLVPGILLAILLMIYTYIISVKRNYPKAENVGKKHYWKTIANAIWGLITILIIVFGVVSGVFTATESAAIAAVYAFIVTFFIYKDISIKHFGTILNKALRTISMVMILIATSNAFGWLLTYVRIPKLVSDAIMGVTENKVLIMLLIILILLLLGMVMDMAAIILIATPIFLPIAASIGFDPIHFGIIMMLTLGLGIVTPPVGLTLFIGSAISGDRIGTLAKSMIPFYILFLIAILIITFVPTITMFLPEMFM